MPKKTFQNEFNPALQFISTLPDKKDEKKQEPEIQEIETTPAPVPKKRNPLYIETKSKRIQILMQPSLHNKLKTIATQKETSLNDLIHTILEQSVQKIK
jgi:predicted HicB family RNase H-like nuclease